MNEWSCDDDDLLQSLDKAWTEDDVIWDSIPHNERIRGPFFLGSVASPVDDRERSALEQVDVPV
jgi:hypothetical protein